VEYVGEDGGDAPVAAVPGYGSAVGADDQGEVIFAERSSTAGNCLVKPAAGVDDGGDVSEADSLSVAVGAVGECDRRAE
jgi:hypothetical protein